jgi:hypothetical protein
MSESAVILDGWDKTDPSGEEALKIARGKLSGRGRDVRVLALRDLTIAPCVGCFGCWIRTPGECVIDDDGRDVARQIVHSGLLVLLTPIVFGGYSSTLKCALDRSIGILSPLFLKIRGELHHRRRYPRSADLLGIGWVAPGGENEAAIFEQLVHRNALNLRAPRAAACLLHADRTASEWQDRICKGLSEVTS